MSVIQTISRAEMRVGVEHLAELRVSEEELARCGISLNTEDWIDGLGPHTFAFIEVESGEQFVLARSEWRPDELQVWAQLDKDEQQLGVLVAALGVDADGVIWVSPPDVWTQIRDHYDHARWLDRRRQEAEGTA